MSGRWGRPNIVVHPVTAQAQAGVGDCVAAK